MGEITDRFLEGVRSTQAQLEKSRRGRFNPAKHPRDENGRFISVGGLVRDKAGHEFRVTGVKGGKLQASDTGYGHVSYGQSSRHELDPSKVHVVQDSSETADHKPRGGTGDHASQGSPGGEEYNVNEEQAIADATAEASRTGKPVRVKLKDQTRYGDGAIKDWWISANGGVYETEDEARRG